MMRFFQTFHQTNNKLTRALTLSFVFTSSVVLPCSVFADSIQKQLTENENINLPVTAQQIAEQKKRLSEKFYRQALYFYFQNKPEKALSQLDYNQQRFGLMSEHARLFEAGLQSKQGMLMQAQQSLQSLLLSVQPSQFDNNTHSMSGQRPLSNTERQQQEILAIVLLQIAEQKLTSGEHEHAAQALAKIKLLPQAYLEQFTVLQQLLAWPKSAVITYPAIMDMAGMPVAPYQLAQEKSPYVKLNRALVLIEEQQYQAAITLLLPLTRYQASQQKSGFWQTLFAGQLPFIGDDNLEANAESNVEKRTEVNGGSSVNSQENVLSKTEQRQIEANGIQHYARLLLAQLYAQQDDFEKSYQQLSSFPKNSVFSEQALFIYGYSAFQLKKYPQAQAVFNLLVKQYSYSTYSRQALALIAGSYVEQQALPEALSQYLVIEAYYQNKQQTLADFAEQLNQTGDVLTFSKKFSNIVNKQPSEAHEHHAWLTLALTNDDIKQSEQALAAIQLNQVALAEQASQSAWLSEILKLNQIRKHNIAKQQGERQQQVLLAQLTKQVGDLKQRLALAEKNTDARLFAEPRQQQWLARIENSHQIITALKGKKETDDYQARLKRIEGVLDWQLQQSYPAKKWQHQALLNELTQVLKQTERQFNQVNNLLNSETKEQSYSESGNNNATKVNTNKAKFIAAKIMSLSQEHSLLYSGANQHSLALLNAYIEQQQQALEQHLLYCQSQMANLIERLNREEAL